MESGGEGGEGGEGATPQPPTLIVAEGHVQARRVAARQAQAGLSCAALCRLLARPKVEKSGRALSVGTVADSVPVALGEKRPNSWLPPAALRHFDCQTQVASFNTFLFFFKQIYFVFFLD